MQNPFATPAAQPAASGVHIGPASRRKPSGGKRTGLVLAAGALVLSAPAVLADVGAVMAVVPQAETGQSGQMRRVDLGDRVIMGQAFRTDAAGMAQVTFVDGSSFTIGPNSELVIDRFIYNPDKGTAELAATATRGVFRFIGGAASKGEGGAVIATPVGTAGIRGAQALFGLSPDSGLQFVLDYGRDMRFTPPAGNTPPQMIQPGMMLQVGIDGRSSTTSNPAAIDAATAALVASMQPPPPPAGSGPSASALSFGLDSARNAAQAGGTQGSAQSGTQGGTQSGGTQNGNAPSFGADLPQPMSSASAAADGTAPPPFGQEQSSRRLELAFSAEIERLIEAQRNPVVPPAPPVPPPPPPPPPLRTIDGVRSGFASATPFFEDLRTGEITLSFDINAPSMGAELNLPGASGGFGTDVGQYLTDRVYGTQPGSGTEFQLRGLDPAALCDCDYLQWGRWQGDIANPTSNFAGMQGFWVAGELSDLNTMPLPASAGYAGTAVGLIRQNGFLNETSSPFSATADFARGQITTLMSDFNGAQLNGTADISLGDRIQIGSMSSSNSNAIGSFEAGFVANGPDPLGGMIGSFSVTSPGTAGSSGWDGTGIFAGDRIP